MAALTEEQATDRALAAVRAYVGWHLAPATSETLTLDGPGAPVLLLPTLRVTELASITEEGNLVAEDSYEWSATGVVRRRRTGPTLYGSSTYFGPSWTSRFRGLEVTLTHGYDVMPPEVSSIVDRLAARALEGSTGSAVLTQVGQVAYATGEDGLPVTDTLSSLDRGVLDRYKLPARP